MNDHSAHTQNDSSSCLTRPRSHFARSPKSLSLSSVATIDGVYLLLVGPPRLAFDRGKSKDLHGPRRSSLVPLPLCAVAMPGVDRENKRTSGSVAVTLYPF